MAPVESSALNSNAQPLILFATQTSLIAFLITYIVRFILKVHSYTPPSLHTRQSRPWHKKSIATFTILALASLSIAAYHALAWRYASYRNWAMQSGVNVPNTLWDGWYANSQGSGLDDGISLGSLKRDLEGWQLGRWMKDVNLLEETNGATFGSATGTWWTYQAFVGLITWSCFVGIEGRHRNIPQSVTLAIIFLAQLASLSAAQNLFFIILLLTPVPLSTGAPIDSVSHILTPHPAILSVPALISFIPFVFIRQLYTTSLWTSISNVGYFAMPLLLALFAQPNSLHKIFKSTTAARKSYEDIFRVLAFASFGMHILTTYRAIVTESPPKSYFRHNFVWNTHEKRNNSPLDQAWGVTVSVIGALSDNPVISQVGWDVLVSGFSLCIWAVAHGVDVGAILRSSGLTWTLPKVPALSDLKSDAADIITEVKEQIETSPFPTPVKRRGRPRKTSNHVARDSISSEKVFSSSTSNSGSLRRSTRSRPSVDLSEDEFVPTKATEAETDRYDFDETHGEGLGQETEAAALGWGLFTLGGLGAVTAGVLGGESSGR